jgi:hypothetical protein
MRNSQQFNLWINASMLLFLFLISSILITTKEGDCIDVPSNIPLAKSKSIIRPPKEELDYLVLLQQRGAAILSPYDIFPGEGQIWDDQELLFQFESVLDFIAFWEFFVGLQFYEFNIDQTLE